MHRTVPGNPSSATPLRPRVLKRARLRKVNASKLCPAKKETENYTIERSLGAFFPSALFKEEPSPNEREKRLRATRNHESWSSPRSNVTNGPKGDDGESNEGRDFSTWSNIPLFEPKRALKRFSNRSPRFSPRRRFLDKNRLP